MSDYKGIFAQEFDEEFIDDPIFWIPSDKKHYLVKVMHRKTHNIVWTGIVKASSGKDAQIQWRKEYPHIRSQYTHEYCLAISKIKNYE